MKKLLHGWSLILTLGLLAGMSSCSKDDAAAPATVNVGKNALSFEAFATEAQTVTVEANYDWTYTVTGDTQICEVTREEGSNTLTVTPNVNYDNVAHTAQIVITAGEGSSATTQTITVNQQANLDTFLYILNSDLTGDNPVAVIQNNPNGENTEYVIRLSTNNKLTIAYSENQTTETTNLALDKTATRVAIEGCDWITYEMSEETTTDGQVTVLTLSCTPNKDLENSRTAYLDIVSGEGTQNKVVKKHLGIMQMADKPTITVNATEGNKLIASYNQSEPLSFTVAANVDFNFEWVAGGKPYWITSIDEKTDKSEQGLYVRTYTIEVSQWLGLEDRQETLQFLDITSKEDGASADAIILQTAAPKASISLNKNSVTFINGEESETKYVEVTNSFTTLTINMTDNETQQAADWLEASYDSVLGLSLKVKGTSATTRSATVTVTCGGEDNQASAKLTVTQLGTEPSLELDPATVQLNEQGTAVVVNVYTNQSSWEILEASAEEAFTLNPNKENNTITISASAITSGSRSHTYTVKAGDVEKELTVSQSKAYKVGDPFVVNGKTVGIVYEVDEQGMHGKAFSLTVYNINDKSVNNLGYFPAGTPSSRTDGKANRDAYMAIDNWETNCEVTKWTADLAAKDKVDWYVPAIDELIGLAEYMTGVKFTQKTYTLDFEDKHTEATISGIPFKTTVTILGGVGGNNEVLAEETFVEQENIDAATKNWDMIRNLYKTYTNDEQYVVFIATRWPEGAEEAEPVDSRVPDQGFGDKDKAGDTQSNQWFSSTVEGSAVKIVKFTEELVFESSTMRMDDGQWWDEYGASIHPICQF